MSSNKLNVEIIENKSYRSAPYDAVRRNSPRVVPNTSSFSSEEITVLEGIVSDTITMANISTTDISELLKTLPYFEPNENLPLFITKVEKVLETLKLFSLTSFQQVLITQIILSKIKGQAATNIFLENTSEWTHIKAALIKYYGDHRNENLLNSNLRQTKQTPNETPLLFYHKILEAQNALIQYAQLHLSNDGILAYEIQKIKDASLEQFKVGIREPYRSLLSYVPPSNIEEALLKCHEYDNNQTAIRQLHMTPQKLPAQNMPQKLPTFNAFRQTVPPQQQQFTARNVFNPIPFNYNTNMPFTPLQNPSNRFTPRPFGNINQPAPQRQIFPTNAQVFGQQSKPSTSSNNFKPTPMSIQTATTNRPQTRQFPHPYQKSNFISKELHNAEINAEMPEQEAEYFSDEVHTNEEEFYDENYPDYQDQNFQMTASQPPPST